MGSGAGRLGLMIASRELALLPGAGPRLERVKHQCRLNRVLACIPFGAGWMVLHPDSVSFRLLEGRSIAR